MKTSNRKYQIKLFNSVLFFPTPHLNVFSNALPILPPAVHFTNISIRNDQSISIRDWPLGLFSTSVGGTHVIIDKQTEIVAETTITPNLTLEMRIPAKEGKDIVDVKIYVNLNGFRRA